MDSFTFSKSENNTIHKFYENLAKNEDISILFNGDKTGIINCTQYYINKGTKYKKENLLNIIYSHTNNIN